MGFDEAFAKLPLIAILRGLRPDEALDIATALFDAGFRILEVPLNSPSPLASIERIAARFGERMLIGAGTVLDTQAVAQIAEAGARLVVSPNFEPQVVRAAKALDLVSIPGVATPSEAFAALAAGADALKLFPAEMIAPESGALDEGRAAERNAAHPGRRHRAREYAGLSRSGRGWLRHRFSPLQARHVGG